MSPTIFSRNGFRFFFFSNESHEPAHIHVMKADAYAKIWFGEIRIEYSSGMSPTDLKWILETVRTRRDEFVERWNDFFAAKR
jgi:hypothetical protein